MILENKETMKKRNKKTMKNFTSSTTNMTLLRPCNPVGLDGGTRSQDEGGENLF